MKKRNSSTLFICLLLVISISLIIYSENVIESVGFSISIWKDNLFPSLFPFFVVSNLLIEYNFIDILGKYFGKIMPKLFYLPEETSFILFISLISGFPSSAKYTSRLVHEKKISKEVGEHILTFTHFANPLFIISFIGSNILFNQKIAFLILFCHITSNLLIGVISRNKNYLKNETMKQKQEKKKAPSLGSALSKSIMDSLNTTFLLLGVVTCFLVITTIMNCFFSLNEPIKVFLSGVLEMTQGIKLTGSLNISIFFKGLFALSFISFGGFSIHMQVLSFITEENIRYFPYFINRILQVLIAGILYSLLFAIVI